MRTPAELVRRREGAQQPLCDLDDLRALRDALQQDGELVAAQARGGVHLAEGRAQPVGDADEQLVAGGVAQRVVDGLEVVEVDERDRDDLVVPRRAAAAPARCGRGSSARFGRPVSGSCSARSRSWDSSSRCSDASRMRSTRPRTAWSARRSATPITTGSQKPAGWRTRSATSRGGCAPARPSSAFASSGWASSASRRPRRPSGRRPRTSRTAPVRPCSLPSPSSDGDRVARVLHERAQQRGAAAAPVPERDERGR